MGSPDDEVSILIDQLDGPVVVIGAGGFVGANLMAALVRSRNDCVSVSTSSHNWRTAVFNLGEHRVAGDGSSVVEILREVRPRTIFNLAAHGAYPTQTDFDAMVKVNVLLAKAIADWAEANDSVLVHTGSSSEFGVNCSAPTEQTPPLPNSAYAVTKLAASHWIQHRSREGSLSGTVLRLYSVYGPGEDPARLMPTLVREGILGRLPMFGSESVSRDFIYVDDVVDALVRAALAARTAGRGRCLSIGRGVPVRLSEVAECARQLFVIEDMPVFGEAMRSWDLPNWFAEISESSQLLNWNPRISLEDGIRRMATWWRIHGETAERSLTGDSADSGSAGVHKLSAVIACYKDEQAIPYMHRRLAETFERIGCDYEIVFVNDCSPDGSQGVIEELAAKDPHVVGVLHSRNFGSQAAFLSGMEISTGDFVALLDGDLQDPPELIEEMYLQSQAGFDVVYGRRVARETTWFMQRAYRAFYRVFSSVAPFEIPRDAGDFSLMSREVVRSILEMPERDLFIRAQRAYVGYRQTGVDYVRPERMFGRSTNSLSRNVGWATRGVLAVSRAPLTLMSVVSLFLFLVSLLVILIQVGMKVAGLDSAPEGWVTLWVLVLGLGSLNLLAVSVVGEYVGRTLEEVKQRPRFVRRKIVGQSFRSPESGRAVQGAGE